MIGAWSFEIRFFLIVWINDKGKTHIKKVFFIVVRPL